MLKIGSIPLILRKKPKSVSITTRNEFSEKMHHIKYYRPLECVTEKYFFLFLNQNICCGYLFVCLFSVCLIDLILYVASKIFQVTGIGEQY